MIAFPDIDPVALQLGPVAIHWYGLAYVAAIGLGWWYLRWQAVDTAGSWSPDDVADVVFYAAVGGVLGGRIGYGLFYNLPTYLSDPLAIFAVWQGGMSFHGGLVGIVIALWFFCRARDHSFVRTTDFLIPAIPIGLGLGRVANFINQELWGAPSELPWAVVFTHPAAGALARHPSQLYEAVLEGVVLFVAMYLLVRVRPRTGIITGIFLCAYGAIRFAIEFVREPDAHLGYLHGGWLTMGQVLSTPMLIVGIGFVFWATRRARPDERVG